MANLNVIGGTTVVVGQAGDGTLSRVGGATVVVDKKSTGEIVPDVTRRVTLVNAGAAVRQNQYNTLVSLDDTNISSPADTQLIAYNGASWVNMTATGDLTLSNTNYFELANSGVSSGEYGNAASIPIITVDSKGRITSISEANVAGVSTLTWLSGNNTIQLDTADGNSFYANISEFLANVVFNDVTVNNFTVTSIGLSPNVNVVVNGDVQGTATAELTNLNTDANVSITLELTDTGVVANTYGNTSYVPSLTVDVDGRITNVTTSTINATTFAGQLPQYYIYSNTYWNVANLTLSIERLDGNVFHRTLEGLANTSSPTFTGSVTVQGDLTVQGDTFTVNTSNVLVEDPILLLGKNQVTPSIDIGFVGQRYAATNAAANNVNAGLVWDESEDEFVFLFTEDNANTSTITRTAYANVHAHWFIGNTDFATIRNLPSPDISVNITGDATGYATGPMTDLYTSVPLEITLELSNTGVIANTYGAALTGSVPVFTVDEDGRITNASYYDIPTPNTTIVANGDVQGVVTWRTSGLDQSVDLTLELTDTGVVANTYGSASLVPVITVDVDGRLTNVSTVSVAGVSNTNWYSANNTYQINTADGGTFDTVINQFDANVTFATLIANTIDVNTIQLSPNVSITVNGDVQGTATAELTNLNTDASLSLSLELTDTGVVANTYGNSTQIAVFTVDVDGRITNASSQTLSFNNLADTPSPNVSITVNGDVQGVATAELTGLDTDASLSLTLELTDTGVTANTYGSASLIPVITVDVDGRITNAATVAVAGVSNTEWYSTNNTFQINTADSQTFNTVIDQFADLTITGNLTVSGTTTYINTEEIKLSDNIIELNSNLDGNTAPTQSAGISINRGSETDKTLTWDETADKWTVGSETFVAGTLEGTLQWSNVASIPSPNVSITVNGDVQGVATAELTSLGTDADLSLTLELTDTGVVANTYGNSTQMAVFTVNVDGRITNASSQTLSFNNLADLPSPNVSITVNGDVQGVATADLANLSSDAAISLSLELTDTGVVANTYGNSTQMAVFTVDVDGRITNASSQTLSFTNLADVPSPNVSITVNGDVQGVATADLANLNTDASLSLTLELTDTGVVANTYGSASLVPVLTIDVDGRITNASTISVAGVANTEWYSSNNSFVINTADGNTFVTLIDTFAANVSIQDVLAANVVTFNGISEQSTASLTTTSTLEATLDTFAVASYRSAKYVVSVKEGTSFHATEIMLMHDGTNVYITEYAKLVSGSDLVTFTADISGGNVRLRITPASTNSTEFKLTRNLIAV